MDINQPINKYIDHTKLSQTATKSDYKKIVDEALEHSFFSVCVPPHIVPTAKKKLKTSAVKVCSVAGFPNGYNTLKNKISEIEELYEIGCDEVDVVLNISNVKSDDWEAVEGEIKAFSDVSKDKILKIIIESGLLTKSELIKICDITNKHPVSFLKTSTGFATKSASIEAVVTMREHLNKNIKIKASGGIRTSEQARGFIEAGADRLGCSASVSIISSNAQSKGNKNGNISSTSY